MKKVLSLLLCGILLLTACQNAAVQELPSSSELADPEESSLHSETPAPGPAQSGEPADYYDLVFDTTQDEGRLTVRYLQMTETYKVDNQQVTTGDASVYTSPEGLVMLVDCSNQSAGREVVAQLVDMQVETIDILVLSHPHADHIGGFGAVADQFEIGRIYMNDHEYDSGAYRNMMERIRRENIPYEILYDGDEFDFGSEVAVRVFGPQQGDADDVAAGYMDANNCSLALRITYGDSSFWTSGDLYTTGEQALLERHGDAIQSDILKMNHHGWDTSNNKEFVETLSPLVAVGMHDSITSKTVAMRFSTRGILTFYNCADGAVKVSTTGDGSYEVQSQLIREITFYGEPNADGHYTVGNPAAR